MLNLIVKLIKKNEKLKATYKISSFMLYEINIKGFEIFVEIFQKVWKNFFILKII